MIELSGKQKRHLRSLGQSLDASISLGKAGLSAGVIGQINALLARHELIKLRLLGLNAKERPEAADRICAATQASCAGILGGTVLLYRPSEDLPPEKRIALP